MGTKKICSIIDRFEKAPEYYGGKRSDLLALLPEPARRILDVGCGNGDTWVDSPAEVYGIERSSAAASSARSHLRHVLEGDIEKLQFPYPEDFFDCIVCGDVLEHLFDPWGLLLRLRTHLATGGFLLISLRKLETVLSLIRSARYSSRECISTCGFADAPFYSEGD